MARERRDHTLQATELIGQIYGRLVKARDRDWQNRGHFFGKYEPLSPEEFRGPDGEKARSLGLDRQTPLWYYVLKEAEQHCQGKTLGEVGSRIVAEVMVGLLSREEKSLQQNQSSPPLILLGKQPGDFRMADLLNLANCINPLGQPSLLALAAKA